MLDRRTTLPVLRVRTPNVFPLPGRLVDLAVGRELSLAALDTAWAADRRLVVVCQREEAAESLTLDAVHRVGVLCDIAENEPIEGGRAVTLACQYCVSVVGLEDELAVVEPTPESGTLWLTGMSRRVVEAYEELVEMHAPFLEIAARAVREASARELAYRVADHFWFAELRPELVAIRHVRKRLKRTAEALEATVEQCRDRCTHEHPMQAIIGDAPVAVLP